MSTATETQTASVLAEQAPLDTLLWPVRDAKYAPNFTLAAVEVVRTATRRYVRWVYESGQVRTFEYGEEVVIAVNI